MMTEKFRYNKCNINDIICCSLMISVESSHGTGQTGTFLDAGCCFSYFPIKCIFLLYNRVTILVQYDLCYPHFVLVLVLYIIVYLI